MLCLCDTLSVGLVSCLCLASTLGHTSAAHGPMQTPREKLSPMTPSPTPRDGRSPRWHCMQYAAAVRHDEAGFRSPIAGPAKWITPPRDKTALAPRLVAIEKR